MEPLLFSVDENPPYGRSVLYAVQWLLIVLPLITVTSNLMASFLGMDLMQATVLFQRFLLVVGAVTAVQCLAGHRYPLVDGPSAALLLSVAVLSGDGLAAVSGGMLVGAVLLLLIGAFGLVQRIQPLFTDRVVGVVLLLISTTLLPFLYPMVIGVSDGKPQGDPWVLAFSHIVILAIILLSHWTRGFSSNLSIFIGILLGFSMMFAMGRIDLSAAVSLPWFGVPKPFLGPRPVFELPAILSFLLAYMAVLINGLGSYLAVAEVVGKDGLKRKIERGIAFTGVGGLAAALFGVVGTVSYSLSPGVILVTRVGSRFPVLICGLFLMVLAFLQKPGAVLASIPDSVVGAALFVTLAAQMGVGISLVTRGGNEMTVRDYLVIGLPILMGTAASMLPPQFLTMFPAPTRALMGNGLIVGIVLVMLLEHVVLRQKSVVSSQ
ncbi:MAG: purine/pyrimidine permease [bacterium]|nr:MAG: purine/pyrimidine permease [bacterium]